MILFKKNDIQIKNIAGLLGDEGTAVFLGDTLHAAHPKAVIIRVAPTPGQTIPEFDCSDAGVFGMDRYNIVFPVGGQSDESFLLRRKLTDGFYSVVQDIVEQTV